MVKEQLQDKTLLNAKPKEKDYRLTDCEGFYAIIKTNGAKWWRYDYTLDGKPKHCRLACTPPPPAPPAMPPIPFTLTAMP